MHAISFSSSFSSVSLWLKVTHQISKNAGRAHSAAEHIVTIRSEPCGASSRKAAWPSVSPQCSRGDGRGRSHRR